jgi:signal transduction histidine kinase
MTSPEGWQQWACDADRLAALAEFAAGAGHEINNPLATIIGRAQQLLRDESDPRRRQSLAIIAAQAYRIRDMIGDVMLFARPPQPEIRPVSLPQTLRGVIDRLAADLAAAHCRVEFPPGDAANSPLREDILVLADAAQFAVVASELLRNAAQALQPAGGVIRVDFSADERFAQWAVIDHGKGFTDHERRHAFDPFFSGRQAGRGLGFGLCKAARIVDLHGGSIAIQSAEGGPTVVTVHWPRQL